MSFIVAVVTLTAFSSFVVGFGAGVTVTILLKNR